MLKIGVLLGDDIGLEVVPKAVKVMKAAAGAVGLDVQWQDFPIGLRGHQLHGHTLPPVTEQGLRETDGFITGPIGHSAYPRNDPKATRAAALIDQAMDRVIAEAKSLTADLGGRASTVQMGDAVAAAIPPG